MPTFEFEFVVNGPPYSANHDESKPKTDWKQEVGQAAYNQWIADGRSASLLPIEKPLEALVVTYCTENILYDVDNVLKWTLDGLSHENRPLTGNMNPKQQRRAKTYQSMYGDDAQIYRLTSERIDLRESRDLDAPAPTLVLSILERADAIDFQYIKLIEM